jgi:hypothetical protein
MYNVIEILDIKEFNKLKNSLNYYRISKGTNLAEQNMELNKKEQFLTKIGIQSKFNTYYETFGENVKTTEDISLLYLGGLKNFENVSQKEKNKSLENYAILLKMLNVINTEILDDCLKNVMAYLGYIEIIRIFYEIIGEKSIYSSNNIDNIEKIKEAINIIHKESNKMNDELKNYIDSIDDFSIKTIMIDFFSGLCNSNYIVPKKNINYDEIIKSNIHYILCLFLKACGFSGFVTYNFLEGSKCDEICILQETTKIITPKIKIIKQPIKENKQEINTNIEIIKKEQKKSNCYLRYVAYRIKH